MYIDEQKFGTNYYVKRKFKIIYHERISKKLGRFVDILILHMCQKLQSDLFVENEFKHGVKSLYWLQTSCLLCNTQTDKG